MSALFEYINSKASPTLTFIGADSKEAITWKELNSSLPDFKSESKKLAFLYVDNSLASVKVIIAFLKSNHAFCLLNSNLNEDLKRRLENIYKPDYIFDKDLNRGDSSKVVYESGAFKLIEIKQNESPVHKDIKILLSTSGTTGSPKFVKLTDSNFINNAESILDYLPINSEDTTILNLPVNYSYGLSVLITNILKGSRIICSNETVLSRNFWNIFKEYNCNNLSGVPYTYEMLVRLGFLKMTGLKLKYMTQAGGKLKENTRMIFAEHAKKNDIRFFVMYGQTEATARMSYLPADKLTEKPGSIGKPIKNGNFTIDKSTQELIYSGPNVGCGYAENRMDLSNCEPLAVLHTGDLAKADEDGFYYITGRLNRFVKLFGNRVSLDELETDLNSVFHGFIGCCGIEDRMLLIFSDMKNLVPETICNYVSDKYKIHISAIKYVSLNEIPLNTNQKVNYQAVIQEHAG